MSALPPDRCIAALSTTWGPVSIVAGAHGVWACELPAISGAWPGEVFRVGRADLPRQAPELLRAALAYVKGVLEGRETGTCPPVHPEVLARATPFRRAVWRTLQAIPRGQTISYAELARKAGHPAAVRAAGGACGANPVPLFIPCHRVVASDGQLGGFSSGPAWKRHLLDLEMGTARHARPPGKRKGAR
jgi:O-6-methylguanine DNA methyltransferase